MRTNGVVTHAQYSWPISSTQLAEVTMPRAGPTGAEVEAEVLIWHSGSTLPRSVSLWWGRENKASRGAAPSLWGEGGGGQDARGKMLPTQGGEEGANIVKHRFWIQHHLLQFFNASHLVGG